MQRCVFYINRNVFYHFDLLWTFDLERSNFAENIDDISCQDNFVPCRISKMSRRNLCFLVTNALEEYDDNSKRTENEK
jgi:hypothetical protein